MKTANQTPFQYGVKVFLYYFLATWSLTLIYGLIYEFADIDPEKNYTTHIILTYTNSLLSITILFLFLKIQNEKFRFIKKSDYELTTHDLLIGICIGIALGGLIPYIANFGYYADESSIFYEFTTLSLKSLSRYFSIHSSFDIIALGVLNTLMFPLLRALFFIGILFNLFKIELNITRSTIQVALFFVLSNLFYQSNQLDVVSLFLQMIVLCYIYFKTKKMTIVLIASVFYDLPIYVYANFSEFIANPEIFLIPSLETISFMMIWGTLGFFGFYIMQQFYKVETNE